MLACFCQAHSGVCLAFVTAHSGGTGAQVSDFAGERPTSGRARIAERSPGGSSHLDTLFFDPKSPVETRGFLLSKAARHSPHLSFRLWLNNVMLLQGIF